MIYPSNFEEKIGFDKIRQKLKSLCLSSLGTKLVDEMEFYTEYEYLVKVLRLNDEMKRVLTDSDTLPISHCIDLTQVLSRLRIEGTYPDIEELYKFRLVLNTIKGIYNYFKRNKDKYPLWWEETNEIKIYSSIEEQIDKILSSDGRIKDNASHQLQKIRSKIQSINIEISKRMQQIMASAKASGWVDDTASVNVRDGRLVIPLDSAHKRKIKGFIYDESATGKTVYIEPAEIVELNNDLKELEH